MPIKKGESIITIAILTHLISANCVIIKSDFSTAVDKPWNLNTRIATKTVFMLVHVRADHRRQVFWPIWSINIDLVHVNGNKVYKSFFLKVNLKYGSL